MMIYILVGALAIVTSICYVVYIRAVSGGKVLIAGFADFGLLLVASLTTQAWFAAKADFTVFIVYDVIAAVGTMVAITYINRRK